MRSDFTRADLESTTVLEELAQAYARCSCTVESIQDILRERSEPKDSFAIEAANVLLKLEGVDDDAADVRAQDDKAEASTWQDIDPSPERVSLLRRQPSPRRSQALPQVTVRNGRMGEGLQPTSSAKINLSSASASSSATLSASTSLSAPLPSLDPSRLQQGPAGSETPTAAAAPAPNNNNNNNSMATTAAAMLTTTSSRHISWASPSASSATGMTHGSATSAAVGSVSPTRRATQLIFRRSHSGAVAALSASTSSASIVSAGAPTDGGSTSGAVNSGSGGRAAAAALAQTQTQQQQQPLHLRGHSFQARKSLAGAERLAALRGGLGAFHSSRNLSTSGSNGADAGPGGASAADPQSVPPPPQSQSPAVPLACSASPRRSQQIQGHAQGHAAPRVRTGTRQPSSAPNLDLQQL